MARTRDQELIDASQVTSAKSRIYRIAYYQTRSLQLREVAQWQDDLLVRDLLLRIACQCDSLADKLAVQ